MKGLQLTIPCDPHDLGCPEGSMRLGRDCFNGALFQGLPENLLKAVVYKRYLCTFSLTNEFF